MSFVVPDTVHCIRDRNGRVVLLDSATGHWYGLNGTGTRFFEQLRRGGVEDAVDTLAGRHTGVPRDRIRQDVEDLAAALVHRGLLGRVPKSAPAGPGAVTGSTAATTGDNQCSRRPGGGAPHRTPVPGELPARQAAGVLMGLPDDNRDTPPLRYRAAALAAFPVALLLLRLPFRVSTRVVTVMKGLFAPREANSADAAEALAAAHWVSRHHPGRVACLELSLTAVLAAGLLGRRLDWCFGVATDPRTFHAWVEVAGVPVRTATDEPITATYQRVLRV